MKLDGIIPAFFITYSENFKELLGTNLRSNLLLHFKKGSNNDPDNAVLNFLENNNIIKDDLLTKKLSNFIPNDVYVLNEEQTFCLKLILK